MDIINASEAELLAELDRRKVRDTGRPTVRINPDWNPLIKMITDGTGDSIAQGYERDDFKHYVYEAAMEAVYGKEYWAWRSAQRWS